MLLPPFSCLAAAGGADADCGAGSEAGVSEAAAGGAIGLVRDGDTIHIDIPARSIRLDISDEEMARRRAEQDAKGWKPAAPRARKVSAALKAYGLLATSADRGARRDLSKLD